jgi:DNA-binding GntR family transcriptional regulator
MTARIVSGAGRRVADADPDELRQLLELRDIVDQAVLQAVTGLRRSGATWQDIGDALGVTRQACIMRWAKKVQP